MKLLFLIFIFFCSLGFANCPDADNADISADAINSNYDSNDNKLANELKKIITETEKNITTDTDGLKLSKDLNKLYIDSLLELKETQFILDNQKSLILHQR